ncbi:phage head-tail connector protein [Enterococcus pseudoavium]|uniref:Phage head-tail connector protein n=1 Tax=Enterococcus pseudoavium TaxID=44007 RepID=A0AAE4I4R1_9ENTE|nr:phage head-tail connector protein [Enterococcus pseudoavium]MDT2737955.1 phage head-tail connector protein [Enterococcus pseudoavium]
MLDDIKLLLGIGDGKQDALLGLLISESEKRVLTVLNQYASQNETAELDSIPEKFDYIIRDVTIKRFNKINSEGASADSEEGRSYTWEKSFLDEYLALFDQFTKPKKTAGKGIARWI